jgi:hypothetical protein
MHTAKPCRISAILAIVIAVASALGSTIAEANRRSVRVDAGAWDSFLPIDSLSCPLDLAGTPRLLIGDLLLSGLLGSDLLTGASCQYTKAGEYKGSTFAPGDEDGLAALLGPNADQTAAAIRYTFADDIDVLAAPRAFQWYQHQLPGLVLVSLHLSVGGDTGASLDDSTHLVDLSSGTRLWGAGSDGFDGEYFCFQWYVSPWTYLGRWNGRIDDEGSDCLRYLRYYRPLRSQVASRDARGLFVGVSAGDAAFDSRQRFVTYARVTEWITIYGTRLDVFEFDRATGTVRQVNQGYGGGIQSYGATSVALAPEPDVAGDDETRWIAFSSRSTLVPDDPDEASDVFLEVPGWDGTRELRRISRAADSSVCGSPALSAPRYDIYGQLQQSPRVVFECTDFSEGIRRSLWLGGDDLDSPILLWSGAPSQVLGAPRISADGRVVVFSTDAAIDPADANGLVDIYALLLPGSTFERVSRTSSGSDANGYADAAVVSGDGCVVAFHSTATNLLPGANAPQGVFARDRCRGTLELVSRGAGNAALGGTSALPSITSDGRYVAFQSDDPGLRAAAGLAGPGNSVAVRRLGIAGETRAVQSATVAGTPFAASASHAEISAANYDVTGSRWYLDARYEGGHEVLLSVEPAGGDPQLAVVPSPFERVYIPIFSDDFED